jgi:hypothetical protein
LLYEELIALGKSRRRLLFGAAKQPECMGVNWNYR